MLSRVDAASGADDSRRPGGRRSGRLPARGARRGPATPGFEPLGEAASGEEALALAAELRPELILLDVRMPVMDGIETARRLSTQHPAGVIVLISIDDPSELPDEVGSCGAKALIRKRDFGSLALRRLWDAHGARRALALLTAPRTSYLVGDAVKARRLCKLA